MRLFLAAFLMCFFADGAYAQEKQTVDTLCRAIGAHVPIEGVEYKGGVDHRGRAVVPADLNAIERPVPDSISIPVEIDLVELFDRQDLVFLPGFELEPDISNIEINRDGAIFFNGQNITSNVQRTCGTPVPDAVGEIVPQVAPSQKPVKPSKKPVVSPKKSSVKVFNGPKAVIVSEPEVEQVIESAPEVKDSPEADVVEQGSVAAVKPPVDVRKKAEPIDENAIDVEVLKAQDIKDEAIKGDGIDDSILEGQYP